MRRISFRHDLQGRKRYLHWITGHQLALVIYRQQAPTYEKKCFKRKCSAVRSATVFWPIGQSCSERRRIHAAKRKQSESRQLISISLPEKSPLVRRRWRFPMSDNLLVNATNPELSLVNHYMTELPHPLQSLVTKTRNRPALDDITEGTVIE